MTRMTVIYKKTDTYFDEFFSNCIETLPILRTNSSADVVLVTYWVIKISGTLTASANKKIVKHEKHDISNKGQCHWNGSSELKMLQRQLSLSREGRRWLAGSAHCCCGKYSDMFICVSDIFVSLQVTFTSLKKSPCFQFTATLSTPAHSAVSRGLRYVEGWLYSDGCHKAIRWLL